KPRLRLSKIFSFVLIGVAMIAIFGNPLWESKPYEPIRLTGDHTTIAKSWLSFAQHFSINYVQRHHSLVDPWEVWVDITKSAFGNANTVVTAILNNPKEFLRHVFYNVYRYTPTLMQLLLIKPNPSCWRPLDTVMRLFYVLFLGALGICLVVARRRIVRTIDYTLLKHLGVVLLLVSAASMLSAFVVYPREHYLILQLTIIIILIAYFASHAFNKNVCMQRPGVVKAFATGLCIVLLTPYPIVEHPSGVGYSFGLMPKKITTQRMHHDWQGNLKTLEFIKLLRIRDKVNLLTAEGKFDIYVGDNYTSLMGVGTNESFTAFMKQHEINMVLATGLLKQSIRFEASERKEFLDNPNAAGFLKLEVPFTKRSLFLRRELFSGAHSMESK
ncbi:MAG: hypothetical protein KKF80_05965, partial [Candidatus Omnitrophica bacterium]|nr:hypothetical protein [Candidatus Omnitrophota bacterium]